MVQTLLFIVKNVSLSLPPPHHSASAAATPSCLKEHSCLRHFKPLGSCISKHFEQRVGVLKLVNSNSMFGKLVMRARTSVQEAKNSYF